MLEERIIHLVGRSGVERRRGRIAAAAAMYIFAFPNSARRHATRGRSFARPAESFCRQKAFRVRLRLRLRKIQRSAASRKPRIAKAAAPLLSHPRRDDTFRFFAIGMNVDQIQ